MAGFGGAIVNVLQLLELKNIPKPERPDFKDVFYWLPFVIWPIIGAVLAYAHEESGTKLSPLLAMNIGLSAPLIIRSMADANPFQGQQNSNEIS